MAIWITEMYGMRSQLEGLRLGNMIGYTWHRLSDVLVSSWEIGTASRSSEIHDRVRASMYSPLDLCNFSLDE